MRHASVPEGPTKKTGPAASSAPTAFSRPPGGTPGGKREFVEPLNPGSTPQDAPAFDTSKIKNRDGHVLGSVAESDADGGLPPLPRYIVTHAKDSLVIGGHPTRLPRGKILTPGEYDINALLRAGVRLRRLVDGEDELDAMLGLDDPSYKPKAAGAEQAPA